MADLLAPRRQRAHLPGERLENPCATGLMPIERAREVVQQVAPMFRADRNSHQPVADSRATQFRFAKLAMSGSSGMAGESFNSAEADGIAADLEASQEVKRRESPRVQFERK